MLSRTRAFLLVCTLALASSAHAQRQAPSQPDAAHVLASLRRGIHARTPTEITVTTAARDLLLEHATQLLGTHSELHREGGRVVGLVLSGFARGSVHGILGFRAGDELRRVAGNDVTTPDGALMAYALSRNATNVDVDIVRAGAPLTLHYHLVP